MISTYRSLRRNGIIAEEASLGKLNCYITIIVVVVIIVVIIVVFVIINFKLEYQIFQLESIYKFINLADTLYIFQRTS